ncbi:hypothetical protein Z947_2087 [Sulfitobacter geojensis]|nr:hypothetical protein Z947_2087 [Sulfitobacter geojensis]
MVARRRPALANFCRVTVWWACFDNNASVLFVTVKLPAPESSGF